MTLPISMPARPSRLRSHSRVCALSVPPSLPGRTVACSDVDGTRHIARWMPRRGAIPMVLPSPAWSMALGAPTPLDLFAAGRSLRRGTTWDAGADERAFVAAELAAWPFPHGWDVPPVPRGYVGRAHVEPAPLRQVSVAGDLAAALAELPGTAERRALAREASEKRRRAP